MEKDNGQIYSSALGIQPSTFSKESRHSPQISEAFESKRALKTLIQMRMSFESDIVVPWAVGGLCTLCLRKTVLVWLRNGVQITAFGTLRTLVAIYAVTWEPVSNFHNYWNWTPHFECVFCNVAWNGFSLKFPTDSHRFSVFLQEKEHFYNR